jgi:hypothetical protein
MDTFYRPKSPTSAGLILTGLTNKSMSAGLILTGLTNKSMGE